MKVRIQCERCEGGYMEEGGSVQFCPDCSNGWQLDEQELFPVWSFDTSWNWDYGQVSIAAPTHEEAIRIGKSLGYKRLFHPDTGDAGGKLLVGVWSETVGRIDSFTHCV